MSKTKQNSHTPGPWTYRETGSDGRYAIECNLSHRKHTATEERIGIFETLNESNARLIAAAPEMYTLLHRLWAKMDPEHRDCRIIAKLLDRIDAKATGGVE